MSRKNKPEVKAARRVAREERKEGVRDHQDALNQVASIRGNRMRRRTT